MGFDVEKVRKDFPILSKTLEGGKKLVYLDSSATAQKPQCVIDAIVDFYRDKNSNIHRSAHALSMAATQAYEDARKTLCGFFGAPKDFTGVFTRGTTESLNLVAACYGAANLKEGDEILLTQMEHHANIVPWQMIALRTGARVRAASWIVLSKSLSISLIAPAPAIWNWQQKIKAFIPLMPPSRWRP